MGLKCAIIESDIIAVSWRQTHGDTKVLHCLGLQYLTHNLGATEPLQFIQFFNNYFAIHKAFVALPHNRKQGASYVEMVSRDIQFFITVDMTLLQRFTQSFQSYTGRPHRNCG